MQGITSVTGLKNAIQLLEVEHAENGQLLKEHFYQIYESFRPINLLKSTLKNVTSSPYLMDGILGTGLSLAIVNLLKKNGAGATANILRKLIVPVLQFGVTNVIAHYSYGIRAIGQLIFQHIFRTREINSSKP
jgi:hypothetical protein